MRKNAALVSWLPKPKKDVYIYALCEPGTDIVRYVGLSTTGFQRIKDHYGVDKDRGTHSADWIVSLRNQKKVFEVKYLEYFDKDGPWVDDAEIKWIKYHIDIGCNLVNHQDGGRGTRNHIDKEVYSAKMSMINGTPEKKKLFSEQSTARWADPEFRETMKNVYRKPISEESHEKIHKAYNNKYGVKLQDDLGNTFNTLREASTFHNISIMVIQRASISGKVVQDRTFKRLGGGKLDPKDIKVTSWVKRGRKPIINEVVDHNGIIYQNIKKACEALGIDNKKAHRLLNNEIKNPCGITLKRVVK